MNKYRVKMFAPTTVDRSVHIDFIEVEADEVKDDGCMITFLKISGITTIPEMVLSLSPHFVISVEKI